MEEELLGLLQLSIDPVAQVLVCYRPECLIGLSSQIEQVSSHLWVKHQVPADVQRRVLRSLRDRESALQNPSDAPSRSDRSRPDPHLRQLNGFACKICNFRTISKQTRSRHITQHHDQTRKQLGVNPTDMFLPVYLQAWTRNPPEGRYWIVCEDGNETRPVGDQGTLDHLRDQLHRERQRNQSLVDARVTATLNSEPAFPELRPWLERTGWGLTYQNVNRVLLRSLIIMPSKAPFSRSLVLGRAGTGDARAQLEEDIVISADDEQKIAALAMATMGVMERCEHTAQTTSRNLLCWLRSVRPNESYSKPFTFVSRASSRMKYYALLKRFIAMVFRAFLMPVRIRRRTAGIHFKKSQLDAITAIWNHNVWREEDAVKPGFWGKPQKHGVSAISQSSIDSSDEEGEFSEDPLDAGNVQDNKNDEGEDEYDESDECEDGDTHNKDQTLEAVAELTDGPTASAVEVLELLFGLIMNFCTEEITDGRPASTLLVYFSGILGFYPDCNGFLPARSYTPHLAGLMYVQRLLFLEYALPAREYRLLAISQRPRKGQIAKLQAVRRTYAVVGAQSPFEELSSLMAYRRAIAASDAPSFLLRWSDNSQSVR